MTTTTDTTTTPRSELTTREAAKYLGVTQGHIRWMIHKGHVPAHRRGYNNFLWRDDLDDYASNPRNRCPGVKPIITPPRRYGRMWDHVAPRTVHVKRDPVAEDVAALIAEHVAGRRDLAATVRAVVARVKEG